jgi:hypothetical protein
MLEGPPGTNITTITADRTRWFDQRAGADFLRGKRDRAGQPA